MKLLVVVATFIALCAGSAIPLIPGDNSHYVEGESRYIWMPDGDDVPQLVDLQEPVDQALLMSRNGANNQYWLFTRQNPTARQVLVNGNINSIRNSNYRANRPTKVIVHGWNSNGYSNINPTIRDAFLAVEDCNVIVVDWRALANSNYATAVIGVPGVGQFLGNFLVWLFNNAGGNWNQLHLVGFSLGAHIVGNAGRQAGGRPVRITGLDPAGPLWGNNAQALNANSGVQNPDDYQLLIHGEFSSVVNSYFQADKVTKVVVHGWNNNGADSVYNRVMREALLDAEDCNVIAVDYRDVGSALYLVAVNAVPSVGESLGTFLDWLLKATGGDWNNVHLLGYSLGAHVIGNAARIVDGRPARLTGFDPAGPLWHAHPNRLDSSNAQYVECIHTNGGVMGILTPIGHVDFYPNGGVIQPGCFSNNCFHDRSYQFFAASINTGHLVGRKCENISEALNNNCTGTLLKLGSTDMRKRGSGIFGMRTGRTWPF